MRRLHKGNRSIACRAKRRTQQSQFAHTGLLHHQVDKRSNWPPPAGKLGRQRGIAGLNDPPTATRELGRTPQGRVYLFGRDGSAGHVATKNLYIYTVSYTQIRRRELSLLFGETGCAANIARPQVLLPLFRGGSIMRADDWVREAERESKLVDALYKARHLISMHDGMTVRCDGEEWALDFGQELRMIDATLKMAGIDTRRLRQ
jgi:hypothetical protein